MDIPPPFLVWLSVIGGTIAIIRFFIEIFNLWRNRRKLEFRVITSICYYKIWEESELRNVYMPAPGQPPIMKQGDWKEAFCVLEFVIKNNYPIDITVGRFVINNWIFEQKYVKGMYAEKKDYRVFDLFTEKPVSLDKFYRLKPHDAIGFRVEILEETSGPHWESNHSRYVLPQIKVFSVEFLSDYQSSLVSANWRRDKSG